MPTGLTVGLTQASGSTVEEADFNSFLATSHVKKKQRCEQKNDKADDRLCKHSPCLGEGVACSSKPKIAKKLNHQMKILFWTSHMLAFF